MIRDQSLDLPGIFNYPAVVGAGVPCKLGDIVTIEYRIEDDAGKEIANSERRGMPSSFAIGDLNADSLLSAACEGVLPGEERWVVLSSEDWYPTLGAASLARPDGPLLVQLRVLNVVRR